MIAHRGSQGEYGQCHFSDAGCHFLEDSRNESGYLAVIGTHNGVEQMWNAEQVAWNYMNNYTWAVEREGQQAAHVLMYAKYRWTKEASK